MLNPISGRTEPHLVPIVNFVDIDSCFRNSGCSRSGDDSCNCCSSTGGPNFFFLFILTGNVMRCFTFCSLSPKLLRIKDFLYEMVIALVMDNSWLEPPILFMDTFLLFLFEVIT